MTARQRAIALALAGLCLGAGPGRAALLPGEYADMAFEQHPGAQLPLDLPLRDEEGRSVRLGDFFGTVPVLLVLGYFRCRTLCGPVLGSLVQSLNEVPLTAGQDFQVVDVSIDPRETPADARETKAEHLARYHRDGGAAGWHFLTGAEADVDRLAATVGFPFRYDPSVDQYAHPAGLMVVAPSGKLSRYLLGIDYAPVDLRLGLVEASSGTIAAPADQILLLCYGYDPATGQYTLLVNRLMKAVGVTTVLALGGLILVARRGERRE